MAVFDIDIEDEIILDEIEGVGIGYSKLVLTVPGFGDCMSYAAEESHIDDTLIPYDWYKELVLAGARALQFPEEYVNGIHTIDTWRDPDPERRAQGWRTVDRVKAADKP